MTADVDIDFADRKTILELIKHTPARQENNGETQKHNSGVYVTDIPYDPINGCTSIDYREAQDRGYFKLDFLNMRVYSLIQSPEHYETLLSKPTPWEKLLLPDFVSAVVHIGNHYSNLCAMPESVDSIPRMAMFLAVIRPGKKHLIGKPWKEVAETVWESTDSGYTFKKSHAIAYAVLVSLHMKLLEEQKQSN